MECKKQYTKPCVLNKEVIHPDQAIAACNTSDSKGATIEHKGYINQSTYGLQNIKPSIKEAQAVNEYCPVYDAFYVYVDDDHHGYVYDSDPDGEYQQDKYVNDSDVQGLWNTISTMFKS